MISSMVLINDDYMTKARPGPAGLEGKPPTNLLELRPSTAAHMENPQGPPNFAGPATGEFVDLPGPPAASGKTEKLTTYLDMPLLISDHDGEDSEGESVNGTKVTASAPALSATQEVKKSIKEEKEERPEEPTNVVLAVSDGLIASDKPAPVAETSLVLSQNTTPNKPPTNASELEVGPSELGPEAFNCERNKVMKIVVKYVAMKITNSFPPQSSRTADPKEMPLDEFLMILVSRLHLSMPSFMKGIIYLFRYMDIIYFLRYVNQSNNFANYTDMGYGLKKLIVGCYRLVLARERKTMDWSGITGLSNAQINDIVKTLVGRLNGKLSIKNVELVRLRSEIFRFVKMVTKTV